MSGIIVWLLNTRTGQTVVLVAGGVIGFCIVAGVIYGKGVHDQSVRNAAAQRKATVEAYRARTDVNDATAALSKLDLCVQLGGVWNPETQACD